mmetsp:Transcript_22375/g.43863  ORF Transcript_22375/g.43863 Transcript_22375/m.43863 type:complete len:476 (-) Transcript_22375:42-1469(-)
MVVSSALPRGLRSLDRAREGLSRAASAQRECNAFTYLRESSDVESEALQSQRRWENGAPLSPIDGLLVAVKDNICEAGQRTSAGSKMLSNFVSPYDATCISRLRDAGAIFIGKTNMDEFGMGSFGLNSFYGPSCRPGDHRVAGGSSSGSAIAVASGSCDIALGSDTGGSVRLPAAFCGVLGYKPSYGRIPRHGLISYASSLDTIGILAADSECLQNAFDVCAGPDVKDSTCIQTPWDPAEANEDSKKRKLRVGIPVEYNVEELSENARKEWQAQAEHICDVLGASECIPVSIPAVKDALPAYYVLACAEASSNLARYDGVEYGFRTEWSDEYESLHAEYTASRTQGFGAEVQRRILMGAHVLSAESYDTLYLRANAVRNALRQDFRSVFEQVDVLVTPVSAGPAPTPEEAAQQDPVHAYITDVMTVPSSLAGLPSITIPAMGETSYQLIAASQQDGTILRLARQLVPASSSPIDL